MATVDGDIDMSPPPVTPTPASISSSPSILISKHKQRIIFDSKPIPMQTPTGTQVTDLCQEDPFESRDPRSIRATQPSTLTKVTEEAFEESRHIALKRQSIAKEFSRALDEARSRLQDANILEEAGNLYQPFAQVLRRYARGEKHLDTRTDTYVGTSLAYNNPKETARAGPSYADILGSHITRPLNLPQRPQAPNVHPQPACKVDNRIFIRLPEDHPSRSHHCYAVKSALTDKLNLEEDSIKTIQKAKTGLAIVPTSVKQAEQIVEEAQMINKVLGGKIEKAEEWYTYVIDHVPRRVHALDGSCIEIIQEVACEEARLATGQTPVRIT